MSMDLNRILAGLKNLKIKKVIYPVMTLGLVVIIALLVIVSGNFLSGNINKAFKLSDKEVQSQIITLDLSKFSAVAKRLGIEINNF